MYLNKIGYQNLIKMCSVGYTDGFYYVPRVDKEVVLKNRDGEVQKFETISVTELYEILEKKLLKPNCIIPIADFFLRNMRDFFPNKGILELEKLLNYNDKIVN